MTITAINQEIPSCAICLEDLNPTDTSTSCANKVISHIFHRHCIENWARQSPLNQSTSCPTCRLPMQAVLQTNTQSTRRGTYLPSPPHLQIRRFTNNQGIDMVSIRHIRPEETRNETNTSLANELSFLARLNQARGSDAFRLQIYQFPSPSRSEEIAQDFSSLT